VPFADRSNIVYRPLSANIGNRGSRPGAVAPGGSQTQGGIRHLQLAGRLPKL